MEKNEYYRKGKPDFQRNFSAAAFVVLLSFISLYSCGGGVVPYVPTQSGASGASTANSQFFILEKGVATEMFDIKKHQPIFRNIVLTGNERKFHKAKTSKDKGVDSLATKGTDSTVVSKEEEVLPILNIHRLH